jgi:hypothetical protein
MRYLWILGIITIALLGCSSAPKPTEQENKYIEITLKQGSYIFEEQKVSKGDESKLINLLNKYDTRKVLVHNFTMGDIIRLSSVLKGNDYSIYFLDENNKIKQMILL